MSHEFSFHVNIILFSADIGDINKPLAVLFSFIFQEDERLGKS